MPTRLNKYIANAGYGNRRQADELIKAGKVQVNGKVVTQMGFQVQKGDEVKFEGKKVLPTYQYILYNKPKKVVLKSNSPSQIDIEKAVKHKVKYVGSFQNHFLGLLLLTDDEALLDSFSTTAVQQTFHIHLNKSLSQAHFKDLQANVTQLAYPSEEKHIVGIETSLNPAEVAKLFKEKDYIVEKLDRVVYAGLTKRELPRGKWRALTNTEIVRLKHLRNR